MKKLAIIITIIYISILTYNYFGQSLIIESPEKLELNAEFKLTDTKICYGFSNNCKKIDYNIELETPIDTTKIGEQELKYKITYNDETIEVIKTIEIVDTETPVIMLDELKDINVCKNYPSQINYKATDNYDGDITDKVKVTTKDNIIEYEVIDSSGNKATANRTVNFQDITKPVINIDSYQTIFLALNSSYTYPKYEASDNCDGNITEKVIVNGNVDTKKEGKYQINYSVTDSSNNKTTSTINVNVVNYKTNNEVVENNKTIYLTFDDGPCIYTDRILDVLQKYNVKATFFVTGQFGYVNTIKREHNEGHTVGLHTYTHDFRIYTNQNTYFEDLNRINERVYQATGIRSNIIRFPGGSSNTVSKSYDKGSKIMTKLVQEVTKQGYIYVDWTIDSCDSKAISYNAYTISRCVINGLSTRYPNIVLMHDIKPQNIESVELIIQYALANGWNFAPLTSSSPKSHHGLNN